MSLSPETGLDPPDIKVRSAQGFEAADYVVGGYYVWSKVIENLADIGYDPSSMHMAAYDWRLPAQLVEERDGYTCLYTYETKDIDIGPNICKCSIHRITSHSL